MAAAGENLGKVPSTASMADDNSSRVPTPEPLLAPPTEYSWFRPEPMSLCQLYLQTESAYSIVSLLGELGVCQFRDLNAGRNAFQRKFVSELRRCVEMERKLAFFQKEIDRDEIPILDYSEEPKAPSIRDITRLESQLDKLEKDLTDVNSNRINLKRRLLELTELRSILKNADQFFAEATADPNDKKMMRRMSVVDPNLMRRFSIMASSDGGSASAGDISIPLDPVVDMFTLTGTILATRFNAFERMLWRVSRGNILLKKFDIEEKLEDPETGEMQNKCLFILVFQGEKLQQTCTKICDGFRTNLYPCPEKAEERRRMYVGVMGQIRDMVMVIETTDDHRSRILVAAAKNMKMWKVLVAKMKSIYEVLNCFLITDHSLIGECWIPERAIGQAKNALVRGSQMSNSTIPSVLSTMPTHQTPPTLNVTNKFTAGFQMIIDAYGVSNYGEVNPAPFSIITFPFIFAVMFGDTGHGVIMTLFALWLVLRERQLASIKDEIFSMFYGGRYIILLMGLFSIYTGMIYNDIFSKSINFFGSEFKAPAPDAMNLVTHDRNCTADGADGTVKCVEIFWNSTQTLDPAFDRYPEFTYYFGIDPVWQLATNKVVYLNTYKMKISVILGVLQMFFGVILSVFNHIHFRRWISIIFEFIPQVVFLLGIFGYMNFMIIYKWFMYDSTRSSCAPSVLITLINMFMLKQADPKTDPCYLTEPMYEGQFMVQVVCLLAAVASIPLMLLVKPIYNHLKKKRTPPSDDVEMLKMAAAKNGASAAARKSLAEVDDDGDSDAENNTLTGRPNGGRASAATSGAAGHGGGGGHDDHDGDGSFGDAFINQAIHTIEYCLGSISHTASYLRLWALSLAHAQLSEVLWNMVLKMGMGGMFSGGHTGPMNIVDGLLMWIIFAIWAVLTVAILIVMEGLSAFLHALRLHWVEFMSKFYTGAGEVFAPFCFKTIISELW